MSKQPLSFGLLYFMVSMLVGQSLQEQIAFQQYEVPIYQPPEHIFSVEMAFSYASSTPLKLPSTSILVEADVYEIDLVFSKYPKDFSKWRTAYDQLLEERLYALASWDSSVLESDIQWNMILQTSCETEAEAKRLFHGFVIKCRPQKKRNAG